MQYKRTYLTSGSILTVLIVMATLGFFHNYDDVTYCGDGVCNIDFCYKNGVKNQYYYNREELPLTFYPEDLVSNTKFYKRDLRFKTNYREIDFIKPYYKGRLYKFKIPAYSDTCYRITTEVEPGAMVKWSFGDLDPVALSVYQCDYETVYYDERVYYKVPSNYTKDHCLNKTGINTECSYEVVYYNQTEHKIVEKSKEVCNKIEVKVGTDSINYDKYDVGGCNVYDDEVHCFNQYDGWHEDAMCIKGNGKSCCRYRIEKDRLVEEYCHFDVGMIEIER